MTRTAPLLALFLAACAPWPKVGAPSEAAGTGWPKLVPLDQIIAPDAAPPPATDREASALDARAADLRRRAAILRGDPTDMDALRARLAR